MRPRLVPVAALALAGLVGMSACASPVDVFDVEPPAPLPTYAAPAALPARNAAPASASIADLVDPVWLADTAEGTGIPERALAAYAGAALWKAEQMPECGVGWNTLAGIGWVESQHGSWGGASIGAKGKIRPKIIGVALDGNEFALIEDSDEGRYDGDAEFDRAVGPMQMIPESWNNWRTDANADGRRDPQNMYDAVMAAANYLCRATQGTDMVSVDGWQQGIAAYNSAESYRGLVAQAAVRYGGF